MSTIKKTQTQTKTSTKKSNSESDPILNVELGKIKARANNFWIAIGFLIAFTICFITYCICYSVTTITEQYFKNLAELKIESKN